jgi:hypothetical protein
MCKTEAHLASALQVYFFSSFGRLPQ